MKIGVSLYSFHKYAQNKEGVKASIKKAAEMGFQGLDFIEVGLGYEDYLAYAKEINEHCRDTGIEPVCFCTSADLLNCEDIDTETERIKRNIDIAAAYGCSIFRHDISRGFKDRENNDDDYDRAIEIIAPAIRKISDYAADRGIMNTTENHGFFSQDAKRIKKLIEAVDHQSFGALVDIGNFSCVDEDNPHSCACLAPYAKHAHVKDFHIKSSKCEDPGKGWFRSRGKNHLRGSIIGHGNIQVRECIDSLKNSNYDGYLTVEFEGLEDPIDGISMGLDNLKKYLQ